MTALHKPYYSYREQRSMWGLSGVDIDGLFKSGMDTAQIASFLWATEAAVLRELTIQRCNRLGLPYLTEAT